jgi:DNA-binding transcriptional LysR family regulator
MDRIAAMNAFVRVVEAGTFTRAASTLNLPNASVTRLVQGLEDDLEVRLLHRTTRSVTVTPEGANYYERIVRLLAELSDIESTTRQSRMQPTGRVRVVSSTAVGTLVLVPALARFYREHPGVTIDLGLGNRTTDLVADGIDCAVRTGEVFEQALIARRIGELRVITCATPEFLAAHGTPNSPGDLANFPTIGMSSGRDARPQPFYFTRGSETIEVSPEHRLVLNDTNAYLAAGLAGLGIINAPTFGVDAAIADGRLVPVMQEWQRAAMPVHLIYAPNRYLSAKARVFIDWVVELFAQHEFLKRTPA